MSVNYTVYPNENDDENKEIRNNEACFATLMNRRPTSWARLNVYNAHRVIYNCRPYSLTKDQIAKYCKFLMMFLDRKMVTLTIKDDGTVEAKVIIYKEHYGKTLVPLTAIRYMEEVYSLVKLFIPIMDDNPKAGAAKLFKLFIDLNIKKEGSWGGGHYLISTYCGSKKPISLIKFRQNMKDPKCLSCNSHFRS